jgi:hypothetical protein
LSTASRRRAEPPIDLQVRTYHDGGLLGSFIRSLNEAELAHHAGHVVLPPLFGDAAFPIDTSENRASDLDVPVGGGDMA